MPTSPDPIASLRILFVEDDPLDAELVQDELRNDGLAFEASVVDDDMARTPAGVTKVTPGRMQVKRRGRYSYRARCISAATIGWSASRMSS